MTAFIVIENHESEPVIIGGYTTEAKAQDSFNKLVKSWQKEYDGELIDHGDGSVTIWDSSGGDGVDLSITAVKLE